jgi:hypothetical protein
MSELEGRNLVTELSVSSAMGGICTIAQRCWLHPSQGVMRLRLHLHPSDGPGDGSNHGAVTVVNPTSPNGPLPKDVRGRNLVAVTTSPERVGG